MHLRADTQSFSRMLFLTVFVKFSILSLFTGQFKFLWWWTAGTSYITWSNSRGGTNSLPHSPHKLCCQSPWWTHRHSVSWHSSIPARSTSQACRLPVTSSRALGRSRNVNDELPRDTPCFEDIWLCCRGLVKVAKKIVETMTTEPSRLAFCTGEVPYSKLLPGTKIGFELISTLIPVFDILQ